MEDRVLTEREREALTRLVEEHQGRLRAFLCRFETEASVVDELLQDVFIGVISRCEELVQREPDDAGKYLRGVARNLVRLRWRRSRRVEASPALDAIVRLGLDEDLDRESDDSEQRLGMLRRCLDGLGPHARDLVTRYFSGIPLAQIAHTLKQSDSTLRMTFLRIRRQLRLCVETQAKEGD